MIATTTGTPPYQTPGWLLGGHLQTIYPLLIKPAAHAYRRERWTTPDEDFIDLDWNEGARLALEKSTTPLLVLFHGLEGSSGSHYALSLMNALNAVGWAGVVVHFRGCSGEPNRLPRAYHSGDVAEIDWILHRLRQEHPLRPLFAVGVSLGGNVLLKWLGEYGSAAGHCLQAAAAVSAPVDLTACGHHLGQGFNRIYTRHFLQTLIPKAEDTLRRFPGLISLDCLRAVRTLYDFDDLVTGPLHGFSGAADYWRRASSKPGLPSIRLPTLIINASNDPFMPAAALPTAEELAADITFETPATGGHVGFVTSGAWSALPPGKLDWLPRRLLQFFQST